MDLIRKKSGGCSSMSYSGVSDNYMLMDNAIAKTGGKKKKTSKFNKGGGDGDSPSDMFGGAFRRKNENEKLGGAFRRRGGADGGEPQNNPSQHLNASGLFGMGSAITDAAKQFGLTSGGNPRKDRKEKLKREKGGCGGILGCKKNKEDKKGGATGVELAPFISSLVILGLRAANDKALQSGITKKLGSLVSSSKKSKKSKSRRTKSVSD